MTALDTAPADLCAESPDSVPLSRIAGLFRPYRWQVAGLFGVAATGARERHVAVPAPRDHRPGAA